MNLQWLCKWIVSIYIVIKEEWCDIVCKNAGKSVLVCECGGFSKIDRQNCCNGVPTRATHSFRFRIYIFDFVEPEKVSKNFIWSFILRFFL